MKKLLSKLFKNGVNESFDVHEKGEIDHSLPKQEKDDTTNHTEQSETETKLIQYTLNTKDLNMTFKDGSTFNAQLLQDGKPVQNQKLVFNVCNKDYNRKTDENGEAKLTINLNPNKYTIKTTSNNITNTNTITVKPKPNTINNTIKGLFARGVDGDSIPLKKLHEKGYTHIFLSHMYYLNKGAAALTRLSKTYHQNGLKLIIFYTTYYDGETMIDPTTKKADNRISTIISIGKTEGVDGVCLDYNRHNSTIHSDKIMNKITENTMKVKTSLPNKEVYGTCMFESTQTLKDYYHQDIREWACTPLTMSYKYNYKYSDSKMKTTYNGLKKTNDRLIPIFQNYKGDSNIVDIGEKNLAHDIENIGSKNYVIFRYGTGSY